MTEMRERIEGDRLGYIVKGVYAPAPARWSRAPGPATWALDANGDDTTDDDEAAQPKRRRRSASRRERREQGRAIQALEEQNDALRQRPDTIEQATPAAEAKGAEQAASEVPAEPPTLEEALLERGRDPVASRSIR